MYILALMVKEKEFDKKNNTWVHLLGISKVSDFFILAQMQKLLNKYHDNRITVSTDSSSPGQYPIFGQVVWSPNWKDQVFNMLYFPKDGSNLGYPKTGSVPSIINHPGVPHFTWDIVENWSTEAVTRATYHNLYMYVYTRDNVEKLINTCPLEVLAELVPNDLIQILRSMEEMFESSDPIAVYERYRQFYVKFGGENVMNIAQEVSREFFDYTDFDSVDVKKLKKEQKLLKSNK
jgi:cyclophilin family peptidyl-prolyl cis-trans isomerase